MQNTLPSDAIPCGRAAKLIHSHPTTLWRWVKRGELNGWRVGRRLYVSAGEVMACVSKVGKAGEIPDATMAELRRRGLA